MKINQLMFRSFNLLSLFFFTLNSPFTCFYVVKHLIRRTLVSILSYVIRFPVLETALVWRDGHMRLSLRTYAAQGLVFVSYLFRENIARKKVIRKAIEKAIVLPVFEWDWEREKKRRSRQRLQRLLLK